MLAEEQKLRWWGLDMRPRWRRRVMVVVTYLAMFLAGVAIISRLNAHPYWAMIALCAETIAITRVGILRGNGIVKQFEDRVPVRVPGMGEMVYVNGLDEWAQYHYGVANFEAASETQKDELLSRFKMGTRLFPKKQGAIADAPWLDEREIKERDSAERWTLRQVIPLLGAYAGIYISRAARHRVMEPLEVAFDFWMFSVLLMTLPRARVLWTEPDPRGTGGEMALVDGVEG